MKSNTLHFSPTSAGVRIDHLNLQKINSDKNNSISSNNCCNNIIDCNNKDNFSLPRARVSPTQTSQDEGEFKHFLEQIVIRNHPLSSGSVPDKTEKNCPHSKRLRQKPNKKMRNCLLIAGAAVILSLLSFVFLVECRSIKGGTHSKKGYDVEVSSESRIQDTSVQEPDPGSSEEYPTKVLSTTSTSKTATASSSSSTPISSTTKSSSTTKRTSGTSSTSAGRLTRSRVSVICKGGHFGVLEEDLSTTSTTSTSPSSTKKSHNKHPVNFYNNPILHRVSDDDEEEDEEEEDKGGEKTDWGDDDEEDAALSQEESQQKVITVSGYSQVAGGKPETKALVKSGSNTAIKYVPKPSQNDESSATEEDNEGSASSEEEEVVTLKPKPKSGDHGKHQKAKPKSRPVSHKSHTAPVSSTTTETAPPSTTSKSGGHKKNKQTQPPRSKRESSEENDEEEEVTTTAPRTSKNSSKHSSKKGSKRSKSKENQITTTTTAPKNQKGDSGELEDEDGEESLLPTLRKSKSESKREKGKKASERRQKAPSVIPLVENSDLESAEAEPESVTTEAVRKVETSSSRKSSRSKRPKNSDGGSKKEASSPKPLPIKEDSSSFEEYNMEEMPFSAPSQQESSTNKKKSRRSSSSGSKNSRMASRTAAPKQRTGAFSSDEND